MLIPAMLSVLLLAAPSTPENPDKKSDAGAKTPKVKTAPVEDAPGIDGYYTCKGKEAGGKAYTGICVITKKNDVYVVSWMIGAASSFTGIGIRQGNNLAVSWSLTGDRGVIRGVNLYQIQSGGRLTGRWATLPGPGVMQTETLTFLKKLDEEEWAPRGGRVFESPDSTDRGCVPDAAVNGGARNLSQGSVAPAASELGRSANGVHADGVLPANLLAPRPDLHAFRDRWYVSHLLAMHEQPLYPPTPNQLPVYRLLFLPTFQQPALVRLTEAGGTWRAACKRSNGQGGYDPGQLAGEAERGLSRAEVKRFLRLLDRVLFWDMPSSDDTAGLDGSQAVLEGVRSGRYHLVDRWSPRRTPYADLVEFLLGLCCGVGEPPPSPPKYVGSFAELAERFRPPH